jgi:hypothetical protein
MGLGLLLVLVMAPVCLLYSLYQNTIYILSVSLWMSAHLVMKVLEFLKLKWWMVYIITRWLDHVAISPLSTMNACGFVAQATWYCRYLFGKIFFSNLLQQHASLSRSNSWSFSISIPSPILHLQSFPIWLQHESKINRALKVSKNSFDNTFICGFYKVAIYLLTTPTS